MYDFITGTLVEKTPTQVVIENHGIGYAFTIPLSTYDTLPEKGPVKLYVYLHVREDEMRFFGFATIEERNLFQQLLCVRQVGPNLAMGILSGADSEAIREAILKGDTTFLTRIKGVGKKTAERIIFDLRGQIPEATEIGERARLLTDIATGLTNMGFPPTAAQKAAEKAVKALGPEADVAELLKAALRFV